MADPVGSGSIVWERHRTNIVEMSSWSDRFEPGGAVDERADDLAWETWKGMDRDDCAEKVYQLVEGEFKPYSRSPKDWSPGGSGITVHEEDIHAICAALQEDESLRPAMDFILSYLTDAWEVAMRPNDVDLEYMAEVEVLSSVLQDYDLDDEVWDPLLADGWSREDILKGVLEGFRYERKPSEWVGSLVFDWGATEPVKRRLAIGWTKEDRDHPGSMEIELREIEVALLDEWDARMAKLEVDAEDRVDLYSGWKRLLIDGEPGEAKEAILRFVRQRHREEA